MAAIAFQLLPSCTATARRSSSSSAGVHSAELREIPVFMRPVRLASFTGSFTAADIGAAAGLTALWKLVPDPAPSAPIGSGDEAIKVVVPLTSVVRRCPPSSPSPNRPELTGRSTTVSSPSCSGLPSSSSMEMAHDDDDDDDDDSISMLSGLAECNGSSCSVRPGTCVEEFIGSMLGQSAMHGSVRWPEGSTSAFWQ